MTKRKLKQWQQIMAARAEFTGTNKQFCIEHNIPIQTFYSRRHSMGLSKPMNGKTYSFKRQNRHKLTDRLVD